MLCSIHRWNRGDLRRAVGGICGAADLLAATEGFSGKVSSRVGGSGGVVDVEQLREVDGASMPGAIYVPVNGATAKRISRRKQLPRDPSVHGTTPSIYPRNAQAHASTPNCRFDPKDVIRLMDSDKSQQQRKVAVEHARALVDTSKLYLALEREYGVRLSIASATDYLQVFARDCHITREVR